MSSGFSVVLTTINPPHPRFREWGDALDGLGEVAFVVVGDTKTDEQSWRDFANESSNVHFLGVHEQNKLFPTLSPLLGWRTYARKNLGYLYSGTILQHDLIFETDDDTFPRYQLANLLGRLTKSESLETAFVYGDDGSWVNPFRLHKPSPDPGLIWPRGFPLEAITRADVHSVRTQTLKARDIHHVQFLVSGDPDLDAVFRLTRETINFSFTSSDSTFFIPSNLYVPGNTQATLTRAAKELTYFPRTCSLRVADIIRSYWLQARHGVLYGGFNVEQDRNIHDFFEDFKLETDLYLRSQEIRELIQELRGSDLRETIEELVSRRIFKEEELEIYDEYRKAWGEV